VSKVKPETIEISKVNMRKAKELIKCGIIKKLLSAKQLLEFDKEIAAGIYIYVLEEFGKLLLLKEIKTKQNKYPIKYKFEFLSYPIKFTKAFDYLQKNKHSKCIVLNNEGSYTATSHSWKTYSIGLLPKTEARLGIFYVDFIESKNKDEYEVMKIPTVDENKLKNAIYELENVMKTFEIE